MQVSYPENMETHFDELDVGEAFMYNGHLWLKAAPQDLLYRASIVKDVIARGDGFAVRLESGLFSIWRRDAVVVRAVALVDVQA
jgi:hypothetical protein